MTTKNSKLRNFIIGSVALTGMFAVAGSALFFTTPSSAAEFDNASAIMAAAPEQERLTFAAGPGANAEFAARGRQGPSQRGFANREVIHQAIADALGITVEELDAARADGQSWKDLAEELNVDVETVFAAIEQAATDAINQAVADGDLTQEQADTILTRMELKSLARQIVDKDVIHAAIADALGVTVEELEAAREAGTMRELVEASGLTRAELQEVATETRNQMIEQAVEDGTITQEQADELLESDGPGFGRGHGRGHGNGPGGRGPNGGGAGFPRGPQQAPAIDVEA